MRSLIFPAALTAMVCFFSACSDDDCSPCNCPPVKEQPLAEIVRMYSGTTGSIINSLRIEYSYTTGDTLYHLSLDANDKEQKYTFDNSNHPDFDFAAAMLKNGVNDNLFIYLRLPGGTVIQGGSNSEGLLLKGGYSGDYYPDLQGAEITRVDVYIDNIWFNYDNPPNTGYMLLYHAVIMGRP